uniref:Uncharacterized protein n=1 Tax=Salmonella enterica subsp. indica TaxID=59207 RepID=I3W3W7_SALER|nr:hypothetical protein [Salmonella enterica subsp. indica]
MTATVILNKIKGAPGDVSGQIPAHWWPTPLASFRLRVNSPGAWTNSLF